jgi:hypothetical protein
VAPAPAAAAPAPLAPAAVLLFVLPPYSSLSVKRSLMSLAAKKRRWRGSCSTLFVKKDL